MKPSRKNKYGAKPVTVDGVRFDSKREQKRFWELQQLQQAGEILHLERQVPIHLQGQHDAIRTPTGRKAKYVSDFRYYDVRLQCWVYEDSKGYPTKEYQLKRAILKAMGIEIRET